MPCQKIVSRRNDNHCDINVTRINTHSIMNFPRGKFLRNKLRCNQFPRSRLPALLFVKIFYVYFIVPKWVDDYWTQKSCDIKNYYTVFPSKLLKWFPITLSYSLDDRAKNTDTVIIQWVHSSSYHHLNFSIIISCTNAIACNQTNFTQMRSLLRQHRADHNVSNMCSCL